MRHEQKPLSQVPVGDRFMLGALQLDKRRYYVVLKHYDGYTMMNVEESYPIIDAQGNLTGEIGWVWRKRRSTEVIPRTRIRYISHYEDVVSKGMSNKEPVWVETVWDNADIMVMHLIPDGQ